MKRGEAGPLPTERHQCVVNHMGFAVAIGRKAARGRLSPDDVARTSYFALARAAVHVNPEDEKFRSYASVSIRGAITREMHNNRVIAVPEWSLYTDDAARALRPTSLDLPDPEVGRPLSGLLPDRHEGPALEFDERDRLRHCLDRLTPRDRDVIESRYGLGPGGTEETLKEIAGRLGVNVSRAWKIEKRALEKLRLMYGIPERSPAS